MFDIHNAFPLLVILRRRVQQVKRAQGVLEVLGEYFVVGA